MTAPPASVSQLDNPQAVPVWPALDRCVKFLVSLLLAYWGAFALLTPVTVTDSQTYNLARLPLAERYGLFGNQLWYSERQVAFPWSFDAIHLGFLKLGFGYALPSFLCLVGTLIVVFRLARSWAGPRAAWWTLLLVLSMSTIVFQATSTKNDLGVVFASAAGFYALWQFGQNSESLWLAVFALAVGFLPGIKDSGILPALALLLLAGWQLRGNRRLLAKVMAGCAVSLLLFGSAEIYYDNWLRYGHILGSTALVATHSNPDGIRGAAANFIRYIFGIVNLGWTPPYGTPPYVPALEHACRSVLRAAGLVNVGYWPYTNDDSMRILRLGGETTSDYAIVGTCLAPLAIWQLVRRPMRNPAWWLAAIGWLYFAGIAFTIAWMPFNIRFLMPSFVLFALAATVGEQELLARSRTFRTGLFVLAAYSALIPTYYSFNKQPRDLIGGVTQREWETYLELPTMRPIVHATKDWLSAHPSGRILLVAGGNSWVLPFFTSGITRVEPVVSMPLTAGQMPTAARPVAILVLDRPDFALSTAGLKLISLQIFQESGSALFEAFPEVN